MFKYMMILVIIMGAIVIFTALFRPEKPVLNKILTGIMGMSASACLLLLLISVLHF